MRRYLIFFLVLITASLAGLPSLRAFAQTVSPTPIQYDFGIYSPVAGNALQGSVPIVGHTDIEGFASYEISFAYQEDPSDSWFLIHQSEEPAVNETLFIWDTSKISDGDYIIKLTITDIDGKQQVFTVDDIRVRNYTAVETDTPLPPTKTATPAPRITPSPTPTPLPTATMPPPTSTAIPPNPAAISEQEVITNIGIGVLGTLTAFLLFGIYQRVRASARRGYQDDL